MIYSTQVNKDHYGIRGYDSLDRFISYFHQKDFVLKYSSELEHVSILEIGKGNGFLGNYLEKQGLNTKTFDIAADLSPDYVGNVVELSSAIPEKFDIVCAFEILEHIAYEDAEKALEQIGLVTKRYAIISVPQSGYRWSAWMNVNYILFLKFALQIKSLSKFIPNKEHYWELAHPGYEVSKFKKALSRNFTILEDYTDPLDSYHRYFVLEKI